MRKELRKLEYKICVYGGMVIMGALSFISHLIFEDTNQYMSILFVATAIMAIKFLWHVGKREDADDFRVIPTWGHDKPQVRQKTKQKSKQDYIGGTFFYDDLVVAQEDDSSKKDAYA